MLELRPNYARKENAYGQDAFHYLFDIQHVQTHHDLIGMKTIVLSEERVKKSNDLLAMYIRFFS